MELVQRIGQTLELAKRQEKLFEVKQVTSKKATKTTKTWEDSSSGKKWGTQTTTSGKDPDTFPRPKNYQCLTDEEKAQRETRLKGISDNLQKKRKNRKLCMRCGQLGHGQYTCLAPRPVISATTVEDTKKRKRVKKEDQPEDQSQKKKVALSSSRGRIYEVTEDDEEMEENP